MLFIPAAASCGVLRLKIRKKLDLIRAKRGHKACQEEIRKLREEYLLHTMGDFYEKGV